MACKKKKKKKGIVAILMIGLLTGCSMFELTSDRPGYEAGRLAAAVYIDTLPVQSEQMNSALKVSYSVLKQVTFTGSTNTIESLVAAEIAKLTLGAQSAVVNELALSQIRIAQDKLFSEFGQAVPPEQAVAILRNFQAGIDDVLKLQVN